VLHEYAIVVPPRALTFRTHVLVMLAAKEAQLTLMSQALFQQIEEELAALEGRLHVTMPSRRGWFAVSWCVSV
jgi:hypothetical protein